MNTLEKQDIQQLKQIIDSVKTVNYTHIVLMVNTKEQVKMFQENLPKEAPPYVHMLCADGRLESDEKVYILPCGEKPIKFIWE